MLAPSQTSLGRRGVVRGRETGEATCLEDKQRPPPPLEELTNMLRVVTMFVGILGRRNSWLANILC